MTRAIAVVLFCLLSAYVHAQYASRGGRFQVNEVKGCAPLSVTVSIVPPDVCDDENACDMDFEGNNDFEGLLFNYEYTQPGTYWLRVNFQVSGMDSIAIEVLPNVQPQFNVYTCSNNEVSVQLDDSNYDEYILDYRDGTPTTVVSGNSTNTHVYAPGTHTVEVRGRNLNAADNCDAGGRIVTPLTTLPAPVITSLVVVDNTSIRLAFNALPNVQYMLGVATNNTTNFQQAGTIYNASVDTVLNLRTDDNYYCFQLAAFDPCNNTVINSAVICSADLDLTVGNKVIDINWSTAQAGITGYSLSRTASDGTTLITQPTASPTRDLGIVCGTEYCYQLTALYANGSRSVSMVKCGTGFSTEVPAAIRNITTIVGDNSVVLEWKADANFIPAEFTIHKAVGGSYGLLATTVQQAFPDAEYNTEEGACYRIGYRDVCDNESPLSIEACPIQLNGSLLHDNSVNLTWTPYEGYANGVANYVLEKYSEDGTLLQTIDVGTATAYVDASDNLDHQAFIYVIRANAADAGVVASVSNRVAILKDPNIFHPTAFTPNGDSLNDIFTVFGQYVEAFEMQIFNRWGELLFSTNDITSGWDGTYRGNEMPEGTYTFIARITDRAGRTFKRSGSVLLLRRD